MKALITKYLFLAIALTGISSLWIARQAGLDLNSLAIVLSSMTLGLGMLFERIYPFRENWNQSKGDTKIDVTSTVVVMGLIDPLTKLSASLLVVAVYPHFNLTIVTLLNEHPFAIQLLWVCLWVELGYYWAHRWHHTNPSLWWLHAMHHSSQRLYVLNNFRFHPLNYVINFALSTLPLMLLGVDAEVLLAYVVLTQPLLMLQHANIDLRSGWLNYVFNTNENHRWHHSTETHEANSNYGHVLMIWDHVFRTFYHRPFEQPVHIGLFEQSNRYPSQAGYLAQLRSMFSPACCTSNRTGL